MRRTAPHLVVLQGALNSIRVFLPAMPPSTVSGKVTSAQMTRMITIVPKGSAAVLCTGPTTVDEHAQVYTVQSAVQDPSQGTTQQWDASCTCKDHSGCRQSDNRVYNDVEHAGSFKKTLACRGAPGRRWRRC